MSSHDLWSTAMGRWCDDLSDLMLPFERIALQRGDLLCMGNATPGFARAMGAPCPAALSDTLCDDLATIMAQFPQGAHLRLDLCSLKSVQGAPMASDAATALALLTQPNPRVAGLIKRGLDDGEALSLFVFPWRAIPEWSEFRIFVRDGRLVGISQMDRHRVFPQIAQAIRSLEPALMAFAHHIIPRLPLRDMAIDVFAELAPGLPCKIWLIELNPFVQRTDPGLFTWEFGGDFDGRLRYLGPVAKAAPPVQTAAFAFAFAAPADQETDIWRI